MGTSMAFYFIKNIEFSPTGLVEKIKEISRFSDAEARNELKMIEMFMPPELIEQMHKEVAASKAHIDSIFGQSRGESRPAIAYSATAEWLPLFDERMCAGNNASEADLTRLFDVFGVPVLALSIFDSDVLLLSYIDEVEQIRNHAKPNIDGFMDYDVDQYSKEFPDFLAEVFTGSSGDELRAVWAKEDYVFADDRMHDMCRLLNIAPLYDSNEIPDGYQAVYAD